ncbi:MAG: PQQ-like beta-propeller repeat protein [Actinomycetota bacterium]|nr:PQQ-like beta-propeller repeat protein [Actinomycetota bacterium]
MLATAPPATGTVTYQVDAAHTGNVADANLDPPLGRKWIRRDLGRPLTNPLMAEGRVYVLSAPPQQGLMIHALDPATGNTIWSKPAPLENGASFSFGFSYDQGRLFANGGRMIRAHSAATGEPLWTRPLNDSRGAAVAEGGSVYLVDITGGLRAFRGSDGVEQPGAQIGSGGREVAVQGDRVFSGEGCRRVDAFDRALLTRVWSYSGGCNDWVDDPPPAVHRGRVYAHASRAGSGVILDAANGQRLGTFAAERSPAFAGNLGFYRGDLPLIAVNLDTGGEAWRYTSEPGGSREELAGIPLVVEKSVFVLTRDGELIAVDRDSGRERWRGALSPIVDHGMTSLPLPPPMAAAGDRLIVTYRDRLTAFGPGPDAPGIDEPDKIPAGGLRYELRAEPEDLPYLSKARIAVRANGSLSGAHEIELQADPYPYGEWRAVKRARPSFDDHTFEVKPDRNTRYRVVDRSTYPTIESEAVTVYPFYGGSPAFWLVGRSSMQVRGTVTAPSWLRVTRRRAYLYRARARNKPGTRIGSLRVRRVGKERYRLVGTVRVPALRRRDLFFVCIPIAKPKAFGRLPHDHCGRRRL